MKRNGTMAKPEISAAPVCCFRPKMLCSRMSNAGNQSGAAGRNCRTFAYRSGLSRRNRAHGANRRERRCRPRWRQRFCSITSSTDRSCRGRKGPSLCAQTAVGWPFSFGLLRAPARAVHPLPWPWRTSVLRFLCRSPPKSRRASACVSCSSVSALRLFLYWPRRSSTQP